MRSESNHRLTSREHRLHTLTRYNSAGRNRNSRQLEHQRVNERDVLCEIGESFQAYPSDTSMRQVYVNYYSALRQRWNVPGKPVIPHLCSLSIDCRLDTYLANLVYNLAITDTHSEKKSRFPNISRGTLWLSTWAYELQ